MENYQAEVKEAYRTTSIVGYSTSISVIIYGIVSFFMLSRSGGKDPVFENVTFVRQLFWVIAFTIVVCISLLNRVLLRKAKQSGLTLQELIKQLQTASMVKFGMCESIGILGLVLSLLTRNINDYYGLGFLSLISFGVFFPKFHVWDRQLRQAAYRYDTIDKEDPIE